MKTFLLAETYEITSNLSNLPGHDTFAPVKVVTLDGVYGGLQLTHYLGMNHH